MNTDDETKLFWPSPSLLFVSGLLLGAVACEGAASSTMDKTGSETHWLVACTSEDDCGSLTCLCGVCSRECSADSDCGGGTSCVEAGDPAHYAACSTATASPATMCLEPCTDCEAPSACDGGDCIPAADDDADDDVADDDADDDIADDDAGPSPVATPSLEPTGGSGGESTGAPNSGGASTGGAAGATPSGGASAGGAGGAGGAEPTASQCVEVAPVSPDPSCEATLFEPAEEECAGGSWLWDGVQCTFVSHQGCASGDCDRFYPDNQSCEQAHAQCLPNGCEVQDAQSNGNLCGTLIGYSFRGSVCEEVLCGCHGEDCADLEPTLAECESRWELCLTRVLECREERFPLENTDSGYIPAYPEYSFSVEGYDELYDGQSGLVAVFADWTAATWLGLEDLGERESCPPVERLPSCPYPQQLSLDVDGQTIRLDLTLQWNATFSGLAEPTEVEVRIVAHPTGTLVLQIREAGTAQPVLMVVSTLEAGIGGSAADSVWEFPPYTFSAGSRLCGTELDLCGWTFSPLGLNVTAEDAEWAFEPLRTGFFGVDGDVYNVTNGYIFERFIPEEVGCAGVYLPRQTFAIVRGTP